MLLKDSYGRVMRDLRVSITDRCNFRCLYCLPESEEAANFYRNRFQQSGPQPPAPPPPIEWKKRGELLTFEEIEQVARIFVKCGVRKIRLTGGEPTLRRGLASLIAQLSAIPGVEDLALTTNGFRFAEHAESFRSAGLHRVSFSLDSLQAGNFRKLTGRDGLADVLEGIQKAQELGMNPVKVNAVIIRELNDHEIEDLAEFARDREIHMRYIEFMPLDSQRAWQRECVVPGTEILERLRSRFDLQPVKSDNASETARRWSFPGSRAEIGIIAPVSEPFCGHCNRLRLTADGKIRTCLFSLHEHDLRSLLRNGAGEKEIVEFIKGVVWQKEARHHIGEPEFVQPQRTMSCIGG